MQPPSSYQSSIIFIAAKCFDRRCSKIPPSGNTILLCRLFIIKILFPYSVELPLTVLCLQTRTMGVVYSCYIAQTSFGLCYHIFLIHEPRKLDPHSNHVRGRYTCQTSSDPRAMARIRAKSQEISRQLIQRMDY